MATQTQISYMWDPAYDSMFCHGGDYDTDYIYLMMCPADTGEGPRGQVFRVSRSDLSCSLKATAYNGGLNLGVQGGAVSSSSVYVPLMVWSAIPLYHRTVITRMDRATLANRKSYRCRIDAAGSTQGMGVGKDAKEQTSIYVCGLGANTNINLIKMSEISNDLTWDAGFSVYQGPDRHMMMEAVIDTAVGSHSYSYNGHPCSKHDIYLPGKYNPAPNLDPNAVILKYNQYVDSDNISKVVINSEVRIQVQGSGLYLNDTWLFAVKMDPRDSNIGWASGLCPCDPNYKVNAVTEGAWLLIRFEKDDGTSNHAIKVTNVYRIDHDKTGENADLHFRCRDLWVTSDSIYMGSVIFPHAGLGYDSDPANPHYATIGCFDVNTPTNIRWARRIELGYGGGHHGYWKLFYPNDGGSNADKMFCAGWGDARGTGDKWAGFCSVYDMPSSQDLPSKVYNSDGNVKETSQVLYMVCSDVTSATGTSITYVTGDQANYSYVASGNDAEPSTESSVTWTSSTGGISTFIDSMDNRNNISYLFPNGAGTITNVPNVTPSGYEHWQTQIYSNMPSNEPDGATSYISTSNNTTWYMDLFNLDNVTSDIERINRVTIRTNAQHGTGTGNAYYRYAYKYCNSTTVFTTAPYTVTPNWVWMPNYEIPGPQGGVTSGSLKWSYEDVNSLQIGHTMRGQSLYSTKATTIYAQVEWTPFVHYVSSVGYLTSSIDLTANSKRWIASRPDMSWKNFRLISYNTSWKDFGQYDRNMAWEIRRLLEGSSSWRNFNALTRNSTWRLFAALTGSMSWKDFNARNPDISWRIKDDIERDMSWKDFNALARNSSWNIYRLQDRNSSWQLRAASGGDSAWRIFSTLGRNSSWRLFNDSDHDTSWKLLSGGAYDTAWRVFGLYNRNMSWNNLTSTENDTAWSIFTKQDQNISWHIGLQYLVRSLAWQIFNTEDIDSSWRVYASTTQEIEWIVLAAILRDMAWRNYSRMSQSSSWRNYTSNDFNSYWRLLTGDSTDSEWKIFASTLNDMAWRVMAKLDADSSWADFKAEDSDLSWNIAALLESDIAWKLGGELSQDTAWNILTEASIDTAWSIITTIQVDADMAWSVFNLKGNDMMWNISNLHNWNIAWGLKKSTYAEWRLSSDIPSITLEPN